MAAAATIDPTTPLGTALSLIASAPANLSVGIKRFLPLLDGLSLHQLKQCLEHLRWVRGAAAQPAVVAKHTDGLIYLFGGRSGMLDADTFLDVGVILTHCDANKIGPVDSRFENMCALFARTAVALNRTHAAIGPLLIALLKRTATCATGALTSFTPIHVNVLDMCLQSNHFSLAARLASVGVIEIAPRRDDVTLHRHRTCVDIQLYFYYSGIALAAMRRFEDATHALAQCIAMPTMRLSAIHVAASKKYVLCSLMAFGDVKPLPKYTFPTIEAHLDRFCTSYHKLTTAFESHHAQELRNAAQDPAFVHDGNAGLVAHVVSTSFPTTEIARLTGTYLSLSLVDIAKQASLDNLPQAESNVLHMIATKKIRAMIDQRSGTVRFVDHYDDEEDVQTIERKMREVAVVARDMQRLEGKLVTSRMYVQKLMHRASSAAAASASAAGGGGGGEEMEGMRF